MIGWGIGEFEKASTRLMEPVFLDNCGTEEQRMQIDMTDVRSSVEKAVIEAVEKRDADWQDIMRKTARLHADSMVLAKQIARTYALEEAAKALEGPADGPYAGEILQDAASVVRALIAEPFTSTLMRQQAADGFQGEPVVVESSHALCRTKDRVFCSCGETMPKGIRTTAKGWHDMHLTEEGIK